MRDYCDFINSYFEDYSKQKESINLITGKIIELDSKGYDTNEIKEFFKLLNETFYQGNLEKSNELIDRAQLLIEATENLQKPFLQKAIDFYNLNKTFVIAVLILTPLLLFFFARVVYVTRTETKLKELEKEKKKILSLMKDLQDNFFKTHMIGKDFYNEYNSNYKQRLGEIEVLLVKLKFRKEHYFKKTSNQDELLNQKKAITDLIKSLQTDYYVNKLIDQDSYEKLEAFYNSYLTKIDENLAKLAPKEEPKEEPVDKSEILDKSGAELTFSTTEIVQPEKIVIETKEVDFADEVKYRDNIKRAVKKTTATKPIEPVKPIKEPAVKEVEKKPVEPVKPVVPVKRLSPKEYFYLHNGFILKTIEELYHTLSLMDKGLFNHHVTKDRNDFANWIYNVFEERELGRKMMKVKSKDAMMKLLKKHIKNVK